MSPDGYVAQPATASPGQSPAAPVQQQMAAPRPTNDASIQITMTSADLVWVIFILSIVELTQSAYLCDNKTDILGRIPSVLSCKNQLAWALAVGVSSAMISLLYMICVKCVGFQPESINWLVSKLLFALWLPGVAILTFDQPYEFTGNGFFATWAAFICSFWYLYNSSPAMKHFTAVLLSAGTDNKKQAIMLLLASSYVELIEACVVCTRQPCHTRQAWAVSAGSVSIVIGTLMMMISGMDGITRLVSVFFVCWWGFACFLLTFQAPFQGTGNGYFACWISFYASWRYMAYHMGGQPAAQALPQGDPNDSQYSSAAI